MNRSNQHGWMGFTPQFNKIINFDYFYNTASNLLQIASKNAISITAVGSKSPSLILSFNTSTNLRDWSLKVP